MASTLLLALSASAALLAGPALACEGQGCWGMAPAQELNPGYTGPDYSQFAPPPPQDGYGPGPDAYQDVGPGPQGYGPGSEAYQNDGPGPQGYGPTHDPQAGAYGYAQGYGAGAPDYGPPPPAYDDDQDEGPGPADGYGPPQGGGPPTAYGSQGAYGPPRDYSPAEGDLGPPEGEPPSAYGMAHPAPAYGADRYSYAAPYHHGWSRNAPGAMAYGRGPGSAEALPPPPYQAYNSDGYEQFSETPPSADYQSHSYRAGSVAQYDYDSGWVEDTGRGRDWSSYPPMTDPSPYGPPSCDHCAVEH